MTIPPGFVSLFSGELFCAPEPGCLLWFSSRNAGSSNTVISPMSAAIFPTKSLSKGSLVTMVSVFDPTEIKVTTRKCSPSWSRVISRNPPFAKAGSESGRPFDSSPRDKSLSPCQAHTRRRPQAASRLLSPARDSAVGFSPRSSRAANSLPTAAFTASRLRNCESISDVTTKIANCPANP